MIDNIVFDLGNVLLIYDQYRILRNYLTDEAEMRLFSKEVFESSEWKDCDRGLGYRDTLLLPALERLPLKLAALCKKLCWTPDFEIDNLPPANGLEEIVEELKNNGYGIYLLSNVGLGFHEFREKIPALRYFDGCFASCDYGLLKPEPQIYEEFYARFALTPAECIFIDDIPANVKASEQSGMRALCFNSKHEGADVLRRMLADEGINISF